MTFNRQSRAASMLRASGVGTLCRFFRSASGQEVLRLHEARRGRDRRAEGEGVKKENSHGTTSFDIIPSVVDVLKKVLIETGKETEYDS